MYNILFSPKMTCFKLIQNKVKALRHLITRDIPLATGFQWPSKPPVAIAVINHLKSLPFGKVQIFRRPSIVVVQSNKHRNLMRAWHNLRVVWAGVHIQLCRLSIRSIRLRWRLGVCTLLFLAFAVRVGAAAIAHGCPTKLRTEIERV